MSSKYTECYQRRKDCFAYALGDCRILIDTDFGWKKCPFYKTREQAEEDVLKRKERLRTIK
jgi:hypothetical protein